MYLHNHETQKPYPFTYRFGYEENKGFVFHIHPSAIALFAQINRGNNIIPLCFATHPGLGDFSYNLEKDFGFGNCSIVDTTAELLKISFLVNVQIEITDTLCDQCEGSGTYYEHSCGFCRGSGKKYIKTSNTRNICASLFTLTKFLNWTCIQTDTGTPENKFGVQEVFLELDTKAGIGGEYSKHFLSVITERREIIEFAGISHMFNLYNYIDGTAIFPLYNSYIRKTDFQCEISKTGRPYIQVPGVNGCSIHMDHNSKNEFTCHNIDTVQQQLCLLSGFGTMFDMFYNDKTLNL